MKILLAAGLLVAGVMAVAQQRPGQLPNSPQQTYPNYPAGTMPANPDDGAKSFADQSFVRKTLEDDAAQVQMGQLAAQKSSSDDVKQFGENMAQIHQQLTDQLKPIAKELGMDEPKGPSKQDVKAIEELQALSGPDFDAAFIKVMLKYQRRDLQEFKNQAVGAQDPDLQQLAKMDEPVLDQHLQLLKQLAQMHNVTVESEK
jgi:putative membrane protein